MKRLAKFIRDWARLTAAVAFWVHALLVVAVPLYSLETVADRIGLNAAEMLLWLFFLTMAILNGYGFWKFTLDLAYIYFFPFIFLYKAGVIAFKIALRVPGYAAQFFPGIRPAFTWRAMLKELVPDDSALTVLNTNATVPAVQPAPVAIAAMPQNSKKRSFWSRLSLPLRSFTIAWCVLLVVTDKPIIGLLGLIVLSIHLTRFIVNLARFLTRARQLLKDAETKAMDYASKLLNTVMTAREEMLTNQDVVRAVSLLALFRGSAFLIINRVEVSYVFFLVGCLIYISVYVRIAILFGFAYLGIAKLNHIPLGFLDAMVNSFAMPLSYTKLSEILAHPAV